MLCREPRVCFVRNSEPVQAARQVRKTLDIGYLSNSNCTTTNSDFCVDFHRYRDPKDAIFGNYPRTTTLTWKRVPAATGYMVEIAYCTSDRSICSNYAPVTINDPLASSYTFAFVGAQPGKWRVTTLGGANYRDSAPSGWRWFTYLDAASGQTSWGAPVLISPKNKVTLSQSPRTTTLAWMPVAGAISYVVERQYRPNPGTGVTLGEWTAYPNKVVSGNRNSTYTFDFIGDEQGRWRVTAYDGVSYSTPSVWWAFDYKNPPMPTPLFTSPPKDAIFGNVPRTTTVTWKTVPGATGYILLVYCDRTLNPGCDFDVDATITDPVASSYTFTASGGHQSWAILTLGDENYRFSEWNWREFTYLH
jgi:hypothetical protein